MYKRVRVDAQGGGDLDNGGVGDRSGDPAGAKGDAEEGEGRPAKGITLTSTCAKRSEAICSSSFALPYLLRGARGLCLHHFGLVSSII